MAITYPYYPHWVMRNESGDGETFSDVLLNSLPTNTIIGVHHKDDSVDDICRLLDYKAPDGTVKNFSIAWYAESNEDEVDDPATGPIEDRIREAARKQGELKKLTKSNGSVRYPANRFASLMELDAARERSKKDRHAHAAVVKECGFRYLAKSMTPQQIAALRNDLGTDFVQRIVFEDVTHNSDYWSDAKALLESGETVTFVIHQGAYDGDPGTPLQDARAFVASRLSKTSYLAEAWHGKPKATKDSVKTIRLKDFPSASHANLPPSAPETGGDENRPPKPPTTSPGKNGSDIITIARPHVGEKYIFGAAAHYDNESWKGPWDCAEFATWCVRQAYGIYYGCDKSGEPGSAYTGQWRSDAKSRGVIIGYEEAIKTPGAFLLRYPGGDTSMIGHIAISVGNGETIEAADSKRGVIVGTVFNRRWDIGVLIPDVAYNTNQSSVEDDILKFEDLSEPSERVKTLQLALAELGFNPGPIDGQFGKKTMAAVAAFQTAHGIVVDGEVGPQTAAAIEAALASHGADGGGSGPVVSVQDVDAPTDPVQSTEYVRLSKEYVDLFATLTFRDSWSDAIQKAAGRVLAGKQRYENVAGSVGKIPWYVVGVINELESTSRFTTHLHNGDPLTSRTVHVPKGRPKSGHPPFTWEESAIDALTMQGYNTATDWRLSRILWRLEGYNGWGTRKHGIFTPYLWSGSQHHSKGKYVADGHWDPDAKSSQVGCAVILAALARQGAISLTLE